ncbi:hypothetical protein K488DRAFT_50908 [Vararia minispora EC-137]|uniref:Uncharacterized protein n=1 Tax=Vararia minispora EC-137 TaxID=1314806 RepID=A0ACB8QJY6_9AGAM|nr:hypothetical protein K488DRAFT_50908 [Vararia minispora EC-137]
MTARRQPSTTSLSQYVKTGDSDPSARTFDFCNNFWGLGDGGVDVLFARMRGAQRTMEELRNFWKERALIEEEYAKRLAKLAKSTAGRDEIGEFRNSIDILRLETEKQSSFHLQLSQQIRNDIEGPTTAFVQRQLNHRKTVQAAVEKQFKNKQAQEAHVNKAREKYEQDCIRINSFTAQSSLMQGKELERITLKLEKAQQTVQGNERDFANFTRALQDTVAGWEQEWKSFCDTCQDLEDERMEFTKDYIWAYANAVSTVCVSDDESCEHIRVALEQFEPEKDQENFIASYGTGNQMPDPPQFVNYSQESSLPSVSARPTTRPAQFARTSVRVNRLPSAAPPPQDEEPPVNMVGVGAGNRNSVADSSPSRAQSRASARPLDPVAAPSHVNGIPAGSSQPPASLAGRPPSGSMVDPATMLVVGPNAYPVDPSKNPQQQQPQHAHSSSRGQNNVGGESDPMYRTMTELRSAATVGRSATRKSTLDTGVGASAPSPPKNLTAPSNPASRNRDYRNSAELVVGSYPVVQGSSRPTSPAATAGQPTAALMKPPALPPAGVANAVLETYHQSFPNEVEQRRSRPSSRRNSFNMQSQIQAAGQGMLERPVSREGHVGIGANGRSPSPALQQPSHGSAMSPARSTSPAGVGVPRPGVGIMLDPNGNVAVDSMADAYQQRMPSGFQQQTVPPPPPVQQAQQQYGLQQPQQQVARRPSIGAGYGPQQGYSQSPSRSYGFQPPQQQAPAQQYVPPPPQQQYGAASPHPYAAAQPAVYAPPPQQAYAQNGVARTNTMGRAGGAQAGAQGYYGGAQPGHQAYGSQPTQAQVGYGGYGATGRSPSPQPLALQQPAVHQPAQTVPPTRQYTEDGRGVLFYVKALYDYNATIPEEFDFQQGDIIAVTATPEDGWWSGELLDEARRVPGRHIFPSNFVHLF